MHKRTYEIIDKEILVTNQTLTHGETNKYPLFDLSENTIREFRREWAWLIIATFCLLPSFAFIHDAISLRVLYPLIAATGLFLLALVFVFIFYRKSYDKIIFKRWQNDTGAFVIWNNKPNKELFAAFVDQLLLEIKQTKINPKLSDEERLSLYKDQLQFLVDETVISKNEAIEILERKRRVLAKASSNIVGIVSSSSESKT